MKLSRKSRKYCKLELDNAEYENTQIQEEINALYDIFTREIAAQKVVEGLVATLPTYLQHMKGK